MEDLKTKILNQRMDLPLSDFSCDDIATIQADDYNSTQGALTGQNCLKCKNKGTYARVENGEVIISECECTKSRNAIKLIEQSGCKDLLDRCTFDKYRAEKPFQDLVKKIAERFTNEREKWFFIGGGSGTGKTHICTAIAGELLKKHRPVKYMIWRDEIVKLKSYVNDAEYDHSIKPYKNVDVLYIDDFLKTGKTNNPTDADINIAFEILNHRYIKRLTTIISSELYMDEITFGIDEALGSRITEMSKGYSVNVPRKDNNFRL